MVFTVILYLRHEKYCHSSENGLQIHTSTPNRPLDWAQDWIFTLFAYRKVVTWCLFCTPWFSVQCMITHSSAQSKICQGLPSILNRIKTFLTSTNGQKLWLSFLIDIQLSLKQWMKSNSIYIQISSIHSIYVLLIFWWCSEHYWWAVCHASIEGHFCFKLHVPDMKNVEGLVKRFESEQ